jgi:hypothetical protein
MHPDLSSCISGFFLGHNLVTAVEQIETILNEKTKPPHPKAPSPSYVAAHQAFLSKRGQIDLTVRQSLKPLTNSPEDIKTGVHFLGENITAALQLGDLSHISTEIEWLKSLLQYHEAQPEQLIHFMETYSKAVNKNINGQGKPISEWLAREVEKLKTS